MTASSLSTTAIIAVMLALALGATPAQAQFNRTWVSKSGSGTDCSSTAPCGTFQDAHDNTNPGGEINCVDAGGFGPVIITKSISIICDNTQAGILVTTADNGVTINAGPNDVVTLKGLDIEGLGAGVGGIVFNSGAALHVQKVHIRKFSSSSGNAGGIFFQPTTYAELYVVDSYLTDNGSTGSLSGGIVITPGGSGSVNASINRVRLENNSTGIIVDGTHSTGVAVNATVLDNVIAGSASDGILAQSAGGAAAASVFFDHSLASGNFGSGIRANGAAASGAGSATVRIGDSTIVLNFAGVSTTNAGVVQSFKNNRISSNLTDGTPIPAFPGPGGTALQ